MACSVLGYINLHDDKVEFNLRGRIFLLVTFCMSGELAELEQ
jgi:hypothetical protein